MIDWNAFKSQLQANPKKMLGFVLGIAACFLLIWIIVVMQSDQGTQRVAVDQSGRLDSLRLVLNRSAGDSISAAAQSGGGTSNEESPSSPFTNALPTFLILLAAIGGLWYWIKKGNHNRAEHPGGGKLFTHIGTQELTAGQQISVIKMNGEYWVIGSGGQEIKLLHRYAEEDWSGADEALKQQSSNGGNLFQNILKNQQGKSAKGQNGLDE